MFLRVRIIAQCQREYRCIVKSRASYSKVGMCRMSSCPFSGPGKTLSLRTSLRMSPKSNERRVQRAFKHARHALIDRTLGSCSIDRPTWWSWRWSTRPWSSMCRRHRNGYKYTSMFCARNPHFRLLYGFADLPERGALTCVRPWRFASIYRDVPHSLLPRVRPMVMSLAGSKEFANCMRSSRLLCFYMRNGKVKRNNFVFVTRNAQDDTIDFNTFLWQKLIFFKIKYLYIIKIHYTLKHAK